MIKMKTLKKHILTLLLSAFLITSFVACDEGGNPDPGATSAVEFAGDWYLIGYFPDGTIAYNSGYHTYTVYNTADDNGDFWIDDHGDFYEIKTKVTSNPETLTFSGPPNAPELITGGTVTVSNGKIIKDGGRGSGSGTVVDSMYFEAEFDWDPGTVYQFAGHKRTGFLEDEH